MPNLDFYAVGRDQSAVLGIVFDLGLFRVFEAYSEPDSQLREFTAPEEVRDSPIARDLMLYALASGPEPIARRIDLRPGALGDATFRYSCQGWGVIQLHFGQFFAGRELRWSHTNHNTEKRSARWAGTYPDLGDPVRWDWSAVARASGRLNRRICAMAISRIGAHPVLPQAAGLISQADLRYEYGLGLHATPTFGERTSNQPH